MRSRCDPFDAIAIRAAIAKGEMTERRAYETYASSAARPYARSSFDVMLRSRKLSAERAPMSDQFPDQFLGRPVENNRTVPVKPSNVLTLTGDSASLSVK